MHEFKHGELRSGRGGKVKSRRQPIAIALSEAAASKYESERENRKHLHKTEHRQARGETYQQELEGKSHFGAHGRRESSPATGGKNAATRMEKGRKAARAHDGGPTKDTLYQRARARGIEGRSKMTKSQLENAFA